MRKLAAALAAFVLLAACGDDDGGNGGSGDVTEVNGIVSTNDGSESGSLFVEVQAASLVRAASASAVAASRAPVGASGDVTLFGSTTDLSGTYDPETGVLALEGGGYTFGGLYDGETLSGTWTGPGGTAGTFVSAPGQGESFCGTFLIFTSEPPEDGTFSFVVVGQAAYGQAVGSDFVFPLVGELTGPLAETAVNIAFFIPGTTVGFASGQINTTSTSGNFNLEGDSGSWTGSPAFCDGQT